MAVFYTLAIHCGSNGELARRLADAFAGFEVQLGELGFDPIVCTTSAYAASTTWTQTDRPRSIGDWSMTCVNPVGVGHPADDRELYRPERRAIVRRQLYAKLREYTGYRCARFGEECQDFLGGDDWPEMFESFLSGSKRYFDGLIVAEELCQQAPIFPELATFAPGYVWLEA